MDERFEDAMTRPFWDGARQGRLILQLCERCRRFQFYPRPFCIACQSDDIGWVPAPGLGSVYTVTTSHLKVVEHLDPPYQVALVTLDEGPRLLTNIVGEPARIDDRVAVEWRSRAEGPPVAVFRVVSGRTPS